MSGARKQGFGEVASGEHIVFIYEDSLELFRFATAFTREGLARGACCLHVVVDRDRDLPQLSEALAAGGVDVDRESRRGALMFLDGESFAGPPPFDPQRMLGVIRRRVTEARGRGFSGLWIAGHMTWTIAARVPDRALTEFETLLESAAGFVPFTVACMFQKGRFDQEILRQFVRSHAKVMANDHVYLSLSPLFQNLARTDLRELARSARECCVPKGGYLFHQGDPASDVPLLTSGAVKLFRTDAEGTA